MIRSLRATFPKSYNLHPSCQNELVFPSHTRRQRDSTISRTAGLFTLVSRTQTTVMFSLAEREHTGQQVNGVLGKGWQAVCLLAHPLVTFTIQEYIIGKKYLILHQRTHFGSFASQIRAAAVKCLSGISKTLTHSSEESKF